MKLFKIYSMKYLLIFLLIVFALADATSAYPESQFNECIVGVKRNPIILGVPETSIQNFCDCALTLIVDQGKDDKESGIECTSKSFS